MEKRTTDPGKVKAEALEFTDERLVGMVCRDDRDAFAVIYIFERSGKTTIVEAAVPRAHPVLPSIIEVFENAEYYEREIHEQFGVIFEGNPRLHQKFLLPDLA